MMLNLDIEKEKLVKIFLIIGLCILIIGLLISVKMIFLDRINKESTYGTITDISSNSTTVQYVVSQRKYRKTYSVYSSTYSVGKKIKIYYDKVRPNDSFIARMRYLILIVPGLGLIFSLACEYILIKIRKNEM